MAAVDRLAAFKEVAGVANGSEAPEEQSTDHEGQPLLVSNPQDDGSLMQDLVNWHGKLNMCISGLTTCTQGIIKTTKEIVTATSVEKEKKLSENIDSRVTEAKQYIAAAKEQLDILKTLQERGRGELSPAESQMCANVLQTSSKEFKKALTNHLKAQEDHKQQVKKKVTRQLKIAYPEAHEEDLKRLAEQDPVVAREAITRQLHGENQDLQEVIYDLEDKYMDIKKLEASVVELHQMFVYLSALVEEQAMYLDNIENAVDNTKEYTGAAVQELKLARKHKESRDRKKGWLYALVFGIATVFVVWFLSNVASILHMLGIR